MPDNAGNNQVPFGMRYWYDHMGPTDQTIWQRFIEKFPDAYEWCQYDVKVGEVPAFSTVVNDHSGGDVSALYRKKIDVVATKGDRLDIIEVKPRASAAAVGQVKNYRRLYIKEFDPPTMPGMVIVTDQANGDLLDFAKEEGVTLLVV